MALNDFLAAVAAASKDVAPKYGLDPAELQLAMVTAAGLEGGLGDTAATGDGGASVGRFQFNMAGGHGSTLLSQGYSAQQIADDQFQAQEWAPTIAAQLVAAKKSGLSGAPAIQQAIFSAERPAAMYPTDRFNAAFSQAHSMTGGPAPSGGGSGGGPDPKLRDGLAAAAQTALNAYQKDPSQANYDAFTITAQNLATFDQTYAQYAANSPDQLAFDNSIKLGDLNLNAADAAYKRYSDKQAQARSDAQNQITDAANKNTEQGTLADNYFKTNSQSPPPTGTLSVAPKYEDALAAWQAKGGVGAEPDLASAASLSVPTPATAADTSTTPAAPLSTWQFGAPGNLQAPAGTPDYTPPTPLDNPAVSVPLAAGRAIGSAAGAAKKQVGKWWQNLGLPSYATGTMNHPGGPAMTGEKGPETAINPDGSTQILGSWGPQVANLAPGTAVIPANVPPDEAFAFSQIKKAMQTGQDPAGDAMAQQQRANDPQLRQKVIASLQKALAAMDATNPKPTPVLTGGGNGPQQDWWAPWRQLTGVPASGQPQPTQPGAPAPGQELAAMAQPVGAAQ